MDYQKQAIDFLKGCKATLIINYIGQKIAPFFNDDKYRNTFKVTIKRNGKQWIFNFYGNLRGDEVTAYDVLACIQKHEVSKNVYEFMKEYGYEEYNKYGERQMTKNKAIHEAVMKEYNNVMRLFSDVIEGLQEIQ